MVPFSIITENSISGKDVVRVYKYDINSTVFAGTDVINKNNIKKYPLATNIDHLGEKIKTFDIFGLFTAISTGVVNLPISEFSSSGISDSGQAKDFEGPGTIKMENEKLVVKAPDNFVWGYKTPYNYAIKQDNEIVIVEENKTIKTISKNDINNDTILYDYISGQIVKDWFEDAENGENITVGHGLSNFSDGRLFIKPNDIGEIFSEDIYNYTTLYPSGSPIMVYITNSSQKEVSDSYTYLGSYPQYNNKNRAFNAQQFVKAWNNTIIPPKSTSSGTEILGFAVSSDPHAPGGGAAHGVCPPARALRGATMALGFSLPVGMMEEMKQLILESILVLVLKSQTLVTILLKL